ncbi:SDR family oxidoreductase [Streptomyces sp. NPDC005708]|uniref:SDR family NAD(P)-dependent oxidoreductase n=1 Tax=Streptomyces sp. NPDC005708 TaxID=3154564 RepID=UPI0033CDA569
MTVEQNARPLEGKIVIVTGGGGVIGRALCRSFADAGASVAIADLNSPLDIVRDIESRGGCATVVADVDVADSASTDAMVAQVVDTFGGVDILINNAGFFRSARRGSFTEIPPAEWDLAFQVNVRGVWNCTRSAVPSLRARGGGRVINTGSNTVFRGVPNFLHYVSSKSALIGLTRSMARHLGDDRIAVNLLYPDFIPDEALNAAQPGNNERLVQARCFKRTQVPEDLVGAAIFLASEASQFITGQSLNVNGGAYFL